MITAWISSLTAVVTLIPAAADALRPEPRRDHRFWLGALVAFLGPVAHTVHRMGATWRPDFVDAVWVSVAVTVALFALVAGVTRTAWRLAPLLYPFLILLGLLATMPASKPATGQVAGGGWMVAHVALSVITYGLTTVAAVAALAAFLQERALKRHRPDSLTRRLPSVRDAESLSVGLLGAAEIVLGLGLVTGMALELARHGSLLALSHKVLLTLIAFAVIGGILAARRLAGVRGRMAARLILVAWLILGLGYVGVKFVTDVLIA